MTLGPIFIPNTIRLNFDTMHLKKVEFKSKADIANYYAYCILGKAEKEKEKLHYENQWMKFFTLLDTFLKNCKSKTIISFQTFQKYKLHRNGSFRASFKKASTGGTLKWNKQNHLKISQLYLPAYLKEIEDYEQSGMEFTQWLKNRIKTNDTLLRFSSTEIYACVNDFPKSTWDEGFDFYFIFSNSVDIESNPVYNQEVNISISEKFYQQLGSNEVETLINKIGELVNVQKIGKTIFPYRIDVGTTQDPAAQFPIACGINHGYGLIQEQKLDFRKNPSADWQVLFEKK